MRYAWELTNHRARWSEEDQAQLGALIAAGKTNREIAAEMGRSQESIRARALELRLVPVRKRKRRTEGERR